MSNVYKKILPEEVYVTIFDRPATDEELWHGLPAHFEGNRPTGNNFIDLFARLMRRYQFAEAKFYASQMGIDDRYFGKTILALTGISAVEWRNRYVMMSAFELLEKTDQGIHEIATRLGFCHPSVFSRFFRQQTRMQPYQWRSNKRGKGNYTYHNGE